MGSVPTKTPPRTSTCEKLRIFKQANVVTRLVQSFGKSSVMNMGSIQLDPMLAPLSSKWRGLRCTTTRPWDFHLKQRPREKSLSPEENLFPEPSWSILNQEPWTV